MQTFSSLDWHFDTMADCELQPEKLTAFSSIILAIASDLISSTLMSQLIENFQLCVLKHTRDHCTHAHMVLHDFEKSMELDH